MHRLGWVFVLLAVTGCTCGRTTNLTQRFGELALVLPDGTAAHEGTVVGPAVSMGERGQLVVRLRNIGQAGLSITHLALSEGSTAFTIELPPSAELGPGAETELTVTFTPAQANDATKAQELHQARLTVVAEGIDPDVPQLEVGLEATALAGDCLVPSLIDFGEVPVSSSVRFEVPFVNGTMAAQATQAEAPEGQDAVFFTLDGADSTEVPIGGRGVLGLRFSPLGERAYVAVWSVRRAINCPAGLAMLVGRGSLKALGWEPLRIDFGRVPLNDTASRQVVVRSAVGAPLPITRAAVSPEAFVFTAPAPLALPARAGVAINVGCHPTSTAVEEGALELEVGTSPPTTITVPLTCQGGGPRMRVSPATLMAFGLVPYSAGRSTAVTRKLLVQNVGNPPPSPNLRLGRVEGSLPYFSLVPVTGPLSDWQVQVPSSYPQTQGLPGVVGQNGVELLVVHTASGIGKREADLVLYSNDAVEPAVRIRLSAEARESAGCRLAINPQALSFGDLPPGEASTQTISVQNVGSVGCALSAAELTQDGSAFSLVGFAAGTLIGPGQASAVNVRVQLPANAQDGDVARGSLKLTTGDAVNPTVNVALTARASVCVVLAPERLDFGTVRAGCRSAPRTVYIYNVCTASVQLTGLTHPQPPFSVTQHPLSSNPSLVLVPGAAPTAVHVQYTPDSTGSHTGALGLMVAVGGVQRMLSVPLSGAATPDGVGEEHFIQPPQPQADILFTIDDSCSMADEQAALAQNLSVFLDDARSRNVQFHIGVVTTDDLLPTGQGRLIGNSLNPTVLMNGQPQLTELFAQKVQVGIAGSGTERPLSTSLKAITRPLIDRENQGFLRPTATLSIIIVTDAIDQSPEPISYYVNRFLSAKGPDKGWLVSVNVVGPFTNSPSCYLDTGAIDNGRYRTLIEATQGERADICTTNWARDLEAVARSSFGAKTVFPLTNSPEPGSLITITVNGNTASGATYDAVTNAVRFNVLPPPPGATVSIRYRGVCL